jgi:hypothetical protein
LLLVIALSLPKGPDTFCDIFEFAKFIIGCIILLASLLVGLFLLILVAKNFQELLPLILVIGALLIIVKGADWFEEKFKVSVGAVAIYIMYSMFLGIAAHSLINFSNQLTSPDYLALAGAAILILFIVGPLIISYWPRIGSNKSEKHSNKVKLFDQIGKEKHNEDKKDAEKTSTNLINKIEKVGVEEGANEKILKTEINPRGRDDAGGASLLRKVDQAREKEINRINERNKIIEEAKRRKEEDKRKENELLAERFLVVRKALQELKNAYSKDEEIDVSISEFSACLTFGKDLKYNNVRRKIFIELLDDNFFIKDSTCKTDVKRFAYSDEVIDYVGNQVGEFLAKRESG